MSGSKKPPAGKKRAPRGTAGTSVGSRPTGGGRPVTPVPEAGQATAGTRADVPLKAFRPPTVTPPTGRYAQPWAGVPVVGPPRVAAPKPAPKPPAPKPAGIPEGQAQPVPAGTSVRENPAPSRPPFLATDVPDGPVQVTSYNCSPVEGVEPQGLGVTYWFEAAPDGDPYPVSIRFTGRRVSGGGDPGAKDSFETVRTLDRVIPGSGRIALTTRVPGLAPGTWEVTATPVVLRRPDGASPPPPRGHVPQGSSTGATAYLPVVKVLAPGVRIGAWPSLVGLGWLVALVVQWLLAGQRGLPTGRVLLVTVLASAIGLAGAKAYYIATHRRTYTSVLRAGMSVQGFVLASISTLLLGGWTAGIPLGPLLDVSAPGLLIGMTIGRLGCFFGGCCAGLPTASRWGIWSSDRSVGVRRIPVQLLEAAVAGTVAAGTLLAVVVSDPEVDGLLFLVGLAAYTFGRQLLFPLRGIPRTTAYGRVGMMVLTGLVIGGSLLVLVLG